MKDIHGIGDLDRNINSVEMKRTILASISQVTNTIDILHSSIEESGTFKPVLVQSRAFKPVEYNFTFRVYDFLLDKDGIAQWDSVLDQLVELVASRRVCTVRKLQKHAVPFAVAVSDICRKESNLFADRFGDGSFVPLGKARAFFNIVFVKFCGEVSSSFAASTLPDLESYLLSNLKDFDDFKATMIKKEKEIVERVGYLAGWVLAGLSKQDNEDWESFVSLNTDHSKGSVNSSHYNEEVLRRTRGGLTMPITKFADLILAIEAFYCQALIPSNVVAYRSVLFVRLEALVCDSSFMQLLVAELADDDCDEEMISKLLSFISRKYARMRGRDYVRKLLDSRAGTMVH